MQKKEVVALIRIIFYILFIGAFMVVPVAHFLTGEPCSFEQAFHMVSPSCGVTRSFSSLVHGDVGASFYYNPYFTLFLGPMAFIIMIQDAWTFVVRRVKKDNRISLMDALFEQLFRGLKEKGGK